MDREQRDRQLLDALAGYGEEWTSAEAVLRSARGRFEGWDGVPAVSAGRYLTQLARAGRCEMSQASYMNYYRASR